MPSLGIAWFALTWMRTRFRSWIGASRRFFEHGLKELLQEQQEAGRVIFTTDLSSVINDAEIIVLAVGTPPSSTGEADLSFVFAVADQIGRLLDHEAVIVVKSTVPVGTNRRVLARVQDAMRAAGAGETASLVRIASVPEFLREGSAVADFFRTGPHCDWRGR
jgi:UDPglucose 6-dehydrogenase